MNGDNHLDSEDLTIRRHRLCSCRPTPPKEKSEEEGRRPHPERNAEDSGAPSKPS
ncbi:MAG: hypothetical protein IH614_10935 [Desulfuromonadales bacterium]|nr:hypothetical protein [Desulfuromonadales bacterium]